MFGINKLPEADDHTEIIQVMEQPIIELERFYHGKTSGIDVKTVLRGGICYFSEGLTNCFKIAIPCGFNDQEETEEISENTQGILEP